MTIHRHACRFSARESMNVTYKCPEVGPNDFNFGENRTFLVDSLFLIFISPNSLLPAVYLFFSEDFLETRPLLEALTSKKGSVLLIDEVDKSDEEFEALLLEILSEFQISIPELGVRKADVKPLVVLTSNNSREIGDALKRRCLHLYIPFPDAKLERQIVQARVPDISESLQIQLVNFVQGIRDLDLKKQPAISETIDWAKTVILLNSEELDAKLAEDTLNVLLKHQQDIEVVKKEIPALVSSATETSDGKSIN